ncbi:hypothetical protein ALP35_00860, partial [Pseudomonas savastanoi pv. glycinea]
GFFILQVYTCSLSRFVFNKRRQTSTCQSGEQQMFFRLPLLLCVLSETLADSHHDVILYSVLLKLPTWPPDTLRWLGPVGARNAKISQTHRF